MKTHKFKLIFVACVFLACFSSCRKYLDLKPDNSLVIPKSLTDCQLLLDDYTKMNSSYPSDGEAAADNYYVTDADYNAFTDIEAKNNYTWDPQAQHIQHWVQPYQIVYNSNLVLQLLDGLPHTGAEYDRIKGTALFFRSFSFYHLAQLFTKPYNAATATTDMGIPLRTSPDLDLQYDRSTLQQTYDRIIQDLKEAADLLPVITTIQSRPNKVAAIAALARTYLAIGDYSNAGKMADEALDLYGTLMDYKTITRITRFNPEVIFQAITIGPSRNFTPAVVKIDPTLYLSYQANDKRRALFFRANTGANAGTFAFNGSYDGVSNATMFTGLATDELYLIRAEAAARAGNINAAMNDLNTLLKNRYDDTFVNRSAFNADDALEQVLTERRKELIFRNQRWTDLRRLNKDSRFAVTLHRNMNSLTYVPLAPDDLRYTLLIPLAEEIKLSGIPQNPR